MKITIYAFTFLLTLSFLSCKKENKLKQQIIKANITHDNVLIRSAAVTSAKIIGKMKKGEAVTILGKSKSKVKIGKWNAYWYKIKTINGKTGWTYGAFISIDKSGKILIAKNSNNNSSNNEKKVSFKLVADNEHGIITDVSTGLMWQQSPSKKTFLWSQVKSYLRNLKLGAYNDWRLPTKKEILKLLKNGKKPYYIWLLKQGFKNITNDAYWLKAIQGSNYQADQINLINGEVMMDPIEFNGRYSELYILAVHSSR